MSCSRTQHSGGRFRTPDLSLRSPTLYHWATALPLLFFERLHIEIAGPIIEYHFKARLASLTPTGKICISRPLGTTPENCIWLTRQKNHRETELIFDGKGHTCYEIFKFLYIKVTKNYALRAISVLINLCHIQVIPYILSILFMFFISKLLILYKINLNRYTNRIHFNN